jgi:hypothetical protein
VEEQNFERIGLGEQRAADVPLLGALDDVRTIGRHDDAYMRMLRLDPACKRDAIDLAGKLDVGKEEANRLATGEKRLRFGAA